MSLVLSEGDRVCIIGGGPAGSFAALHLMQLLEEKNLNLEILIFEPRDFTNPGPGGCNRCAGILSSRLVRGLEEINLPLPEEVIQAEVKAYAVQLNSNTLRIEQPDPSRKILSIYRGTGPRLMGNKSIVSFDHTLLSEVIARGAEHVKARVRKVTWENRPVIHTSDEKYHADLLVLASGVNSRAPLNISFGYQKPKTLIMAQDEILMPRDWPEDQVSAFFQDPPGLIFGALTPKGKYLNISLLGKNMTTDAINDFIEAQNLYVHLGDAPTSLCGCTPRISVRPSRRYFGDRWVAVGDAAVTRLYKDGIGSAFFTSREAMKTALFDGVGREDFRKNYARFCSKIARDNFYGRLLFRAWSLTLQVPVLLNAWQAAIRIEHGWPPEKRWHVKLLWGMFTGDEPYRDLFYLMLKPAALRTLLSGLKRNEVNTN
jgi:flavin-dependent dehydrogenase